MDIKPQRHCVSVFSRGKKVTFLERHYENLHNFNFWVN